MARYRLEWLYFLGACVALAAAFTYVQRVEEARALQAEQASVNVLGSVLQREIGNNLSAVQRALDGVLRDHVATQAPNPALINRRLNALKDAMPQIRGFTLIGADGIVLAATPPDLVGRDFSTRSYFAAVRARPQTSTLYVSPPFVSVRGDVVISVTRMIPAASGGFGGIVSAVLDPKYFSEVLGAVLYASDVRAFIAHGNGAVLVQVAGPRSQRAANLTTVLAIEPQGLGMDSPLRIGIARDPAAVVEPLQRQARRFGAFLAMLATCAAVLLLWTQARRVRAGQLAAEHRRERVRSDAIQQSEARFRTLIEEAPVAVAILRNGKFIYTNRRYNVLHGYAEGQQLNGLPWRSMIAPDSLARLAEQEAAIGADAPLEQYFEALSLGKGAHQVPVSKATTRVELADGPATLIFVHDISAQKRAEAFLLEARDAAEAANRSKAEFLANMSHEIRTPLNAILGHAYLMEQAALGAEAQAMLLKIRVSGKSLLSIINDILDVSKIDAGEMRIDNAWFRPQLVLDNLAATMGVAVGEKDIQLLVQPLPDGVSRLLGDALRLEQILVNLVSNAIKFTDHGSVELGIAVVSRDNVRVTLRFSVTDTGIGIAPHLQGAIFAPFTQADSSTTRRFGGSGLGLTICKKLVTMLGGEIGVDSTPGRGSQFWFTLAFETAEATFSSPEMTGLHALIAHDDARSLASLASTARGLGWQVITASANDAVMAHLMGSAPASLPDVVLLNRATHDTSTLATAVAIRATVPAARCPVVILTTTFDLATLASTAEAALIDAFLTKPVTASTLYNTVMAARVKRAVPLAVAAAPARPGRSLHGIRLLVVDDSEINRDVAQRILCSEGAEVTLANDGQAAVDWLMAHPDAVDLVLMDVQMPVLDGIAASRQLRTLSQFDDLPIVALTAGAFQSEHDAARAAGMTDFVTKPFDIPHTLSLIKRLHRAPGAAAASVIDMAHGIALWNGLDAFKLYLRKFASGYGQAVPAMRAALAAAEPQAAAAMAHKLAGAAGNVALPDVARHALEAERQLAAGTPQAPLSLDALAAALARALAMIEQLTAATAPDLPAAALATPAELGNMIDALLAALHGDNPAPALPVLHALSEVLPPNYCAAIAHALDQYDFRAAEDAARALAARIVSSMDGAP